MSQIIDTTEMYLRTIYELLEEGVSPLRARIAERMQHSGPTVSQTVARMERDGLLTVDGDRRILLSRHGQAAAADVMRRHRLAERLLVDVIGLDWAEAHDEACKWEHAIGGPAEAKLVALLGDPDVSPFGAPIPRLGEPAAASIGRFRERTAPLSQVLPRRGRLTLARLGEYIQREVSSLKALAAASILPGATFEATSDATSLTLRTHLAECTLDADWATQLFVAA